ncbi:hypothetical protein [Cellulomonas sp. URHD0024]|uniref:hypothetical protein n=1 Tax=Cellulomonas sp. URHD0024 TaxID=1302620 RepID=UPI000409950C|nr:hypothetical protein [Cellulomonas sp. URHD0024]
MGIHIGSQNAGTINNVDGDQTIYGGQQGTLVLLHDARLAASSLRHVVGTLSLDPAQAAAARADVEQVSTALEEPQPDRSRIAGVLERLTRLLKGAGSLAAAGAALIGPISTVAAWLGHLGAPVLGLLAL